MSQGELSYCCPTFYTCLFPFNNSILVNIIQAPFQYLCPISQDLLLHRHRKTDSQPTRPRIEEEPTVHTQRRQPLRIHALNNKQIRIRPDTRNIVHQWVLPPLYNPPPYFPKALFEWKYSTFWHCILLVNRLLWGRRYGLLNTRLSHLA